eukprot:2503592-Pleurochrysis_carterae.AAC.2
MEFDRESERQHLRRRRRRRRHLRQKRLQRQVWAQARPPQRRMRRPAAAMRARRVRYRPRRRSRGPYACSHPPRWCSPARQTARRFSPAGAAMDTVAAALAPTRNAALAVGIGGRAWSNLAKAKSYGLDGKVRNSLHQTGTKETP